MCSAPLSHREIFVFFRVFPVFQRLSSVKKLVHSLAVTLLLHSLMGSFRHYPELLLRGWLENWREFLLLAAKNNVRTARRSRCESTAGDPPLDPPRVKDARQKKSNISC